MKCEKCGFNRSSIVLSLRDTEGYRIRRRKCEHCGHRYYTRQEPEKGVSAYDLRWAGKGTLNNVTVHYVGSK